VACTHLRHKRAQQHPDHHRQDDPHRQQPVQPGQASQHSSCRAAATSSSTCIAGVTGRGVVCWGLCQEIVAGQQGGWGGAEQSMEPRVVMCRASSAALRARCYAAVCAEAVAVLLACSTHISAAAGVLHAAVKGRPAGRGSKGCQGGRRNHWRSLSAAAWLMYAQEKAMQADARRLAVVAAEGFSRSR
jgi:hypothetical protein